MTAPAPVDGVALSDPSFDPVWRRSWSKTSRPVFHVGNFRKPFDEAWYAKDSDPGYPLLNSICLWTAPASPSRR